MTDRHDKSPASPDDAEGGTARLWGGRFEGGVDPEIDRFTCSFPFDRRLARWDLIGCLGHARMLLETEVLDRAAGEEILGGLSQLLSELEAGALEEQMAAGVGSFEDVHSFIEATLIEQIGDNGRRLHTGRSRNDQTATALRLFVRETLWSTTGLVKELVSDLIERAQRHTETFLPGYTHLQRGQPVSLAHHLLAHAWALMADGERFMRAFKSAGQSPLGAGALAGTPHPIAPHRSAELLGFDDVYANSMFAVADRDYVVESTFACALLQVHLSRWAEEVVLFTSREFGFARLLDSVAKGSSIMPQKRNPEPAEILRGKAGRGIGNLTAHLVQLKGLPLTYNSDLQEDKEPLFDALDTAAGSLRVSRSLLAGLEFDREAMAGALYGGYITATDLADALVVKGLPFRSAHEQTGNAVKAAENLGVELWQLDLEELQKHCPDADAAVLAALDPASSARNHKSFGGPAPERVAEQIELARAKLDELARFADREPVPPIYLAFRHGQLCDETLAVGASDELRRRGRDDRV